MADKLHNNKLLILGKLSASLAHEIKNPLSVLKLNLDYLKLSKEKYDEETIECIDASLEAADIINQLIYNTLEFSRKNKDDFGLCSINDTIEKSIRIIKGSSNKKNIIFNLNLSNEVPEISVNETKMLQVYVNVLTNAIEASKENSKIEINSFVKSNILHTEVVDQGKGINENDRDKIFDDFFTDKKNGTGLGLSVCKSILDEHEANFNIENNKPCGTKFIIKFNMINMRKNEA